MWIVPLPLPLTSQFDSEWLNEAGNDYFLFQSWTGSMVLHKLGLTDNDYKYRIMWRTGSPSNPDLFMIACGNNKEEMVKGWVWLNENIVQSISADIDPDTKDTAIFARLSDVLPNDEHSVLATEVQNRVGKLFGVMEEDILLHTKANLVGCPKRGILALTTSRLAFFSSDENSNVQVSLGEIEESKVAGNMLFGPSLTIKTKKSPNLLCFTGLSPLTPYEINNMIGELKSTAMRAIITGHSPQHLTANSPNRGRLHRSRTSSGSMDGLKMDPIRAYFKIPPSSTLVGTYSSPQVIIQSRAEQRKEERLTSGNCQIFLYSQWLCLRAAKLSFTIPLSAISTVTKSNGSMMGKGSVNVLFKIDNDFGPSVIKLTAVPKGHELHAAASHHINCPPKCSIDDFVDISSETPESYAKPLARVIPRSIKSPIHHGPRDDELEVVWTDYMNAALMCKEGRACLALTADMRKTIWRHGVPDRLRSKIWPLLANVGYNQVPDELLDRYRIELERAEDSVELAIVEEIERDLKRSLPENHLFKDERGLAALKRVLLITSYRNGLHGYTQAMNMIAAILLIHLPEPLAVEVLSKCTTEWLPDTYSKSMLGGAVDQRVFEETLCQQFPDKADMLTRSGDVAVITFGWFVAWFANLLVIENEVRFFDAFLMEGPVAIYWFGLAVFRLALSSINCNDDSEQLVLAVNDVFKRMKSNRDLFNTILYQAFEQYSSKFPLEAMLSAKDRHSSIALRSLSDRARAGDLKRLAKAHSNLTAEELEVIYDVVVATVSNNSTQSTKSLQSIDAVSFKTICRQLVPWTIQFGPSVVSKLYDHLQSDRNSPTITVDKIVEVVVKTSRASPEEQASYYYEVVRPSGLEKSEYISKNVSNFVQCNTINHLY